jgi:hypothetical protein
MRTSTAGWLRVLPVVGFVVACEPRVEPARSSVAEPRDAAASIAVAPVVADAGDLQEPAVDAATALPADSGASMMWGREWLVAHGVKLRSDVDGYEYDGCSEIAVGSPKRPALMCTGGPVMAASLLTGESLFPLRIAVPEGHAMRSVLEVPLSAGPLDPMTIDENDDPAYLRLEHTLDPTGTVIELREVAGQRSSCADVLRPRPRAVSGLDESSSLPTPKMLIVMRVLCRAKGRYEWRGRSFVRVSP